MCKGEEDRAGLVRERRWDGDGWRDLECGNMGWAGEGRGMRGIRVRRGDVM